MFCLRIYDFLKCCAVHLSEPVLEPNRTGRTGSKLFCSGSNFVLANELRVWFSVVKKWSENRTEPNFGNTTMGVQNRRPNNMYRRLGLGEFIFFLFFFIIQLNFTFLSTG